MKGNSNGEASPAKPRRRKWVSFERRYSNALWHAGWHEMEHPRFRGLQLVAYLDDASRCAAAARLFKEAASENAAAALEQAIERFGAPAAILPYNHPHPAERDGGGNGDPDPRAPTALWKALADRGIDAISPGPHRPRTGGKLGRFYRTVEEEIGRFESLSAYTEYYNTDRLHWSLDIDNYETPMLAFRNRAATEDIRMDNPKWMEEDAWDGAARLPCDTAADGRAKIY